MSSFDQQGSTVFVEICNVVSVCHALSLVVSTRGKLDASAGLLATERKDLARLSQLEGENYLAVFICFLSTPT